MLVADVLALDIVLGRDGGSLGADRYSRVGHCGIDGCIHDDFVECRGGFGSLFELSVTQKWMC